MPCTSMGPALALVHLGERLHLDSAVLEVQRHAEGSCLIGGNLALSLVLAPDGRIPMHDDAATRTFATTYLVPLLGAERE